VLKVKTDTAAVKSAGGVALKSPEIPAKVVEAASVGEEPAEELF
jgi:hypothetical protein